MKYFIILITFIISGALNAQPKLSQLLDLDPTYPLVTEDSLFIVTYSQMSLIVSYLENRVELNKVIREKDVQLTYSDLIIKQQSNIIDFDTDHINNLTGIIDLKEKESLVVLKNIDYKVEKVNLFLGKERDELLKQNSNLKKKLWFGGTAAAVIITLLVLK